MRIVYIKFAQLHMHADHATRNHNYLFKNSFDPKTAHFALFARFSTMKHLAFSIYSSILIMLLLEISGEHVWMLSLSVLIFFCFVLFVCFFFFQIRRVGVQYGQT